MPTTARDDRTRYQRGAVRQATPDRPCRGCGHPIQFIKHPDSGKVQACDCDLRTFVLEDGRVAHGFLSYWSTCRNPPERAGAPARGAVEDPRQAPRRAAAEPPTAPTTAPQLSLLAQPDDARRAGAVALAHATTVGHYDATVRSSIVSACLNPRHELDISIGAVTGQAGETRTVADWSRDMGRLQSLRDLTVEERGTEQRVFQTVREDQRNIQGHVRQGKDVVLRLREPIVARFLGAAVIKTPEREPGMEG